MPYECNFHRSFEWLTLSNALEKSRRISSVCFPKLDLRARSSLSETIGSHRSTSPKSCAVGRTYLYLSSGG